jgi:hypothetical protein
MKAGIVVAWIVFAGTATDAGAVDTAALRRETEAAGRARAMVHELAAEVLDVQLRQLRENGLDSLPLYRVATQMRTNLDGLVEAELGDVVEIVVASQTAAPSQRERALDEARRLLRQAVVRLAARPGVERRLMAAEVVAQVRRLIERAKLVLGATRSRVDARSRSGAAEVLLRDQRDLLVAFAGLRDALGTAHAERGAIANCAAEALDLLRNESLEETLATSLRRLEGGEWQEAAESQVAAVGVLEHLLARVEQAQALVEADRETILEHVRELAARQAKLSAETAGAELTDASADALVARQTRIERELALLTTPLRRTPSAVEFLARARSAAFAASGRLFELAAFEALADQENVSANLAHLEERLVEAVQLDELDQSTAAPAAGKSPPAEASPPRAPAPAVGPTGRRDFSKGSWFDKLPAEVRRANLAGANQRFPRGYEERLKRYFESLQRHDAAAQDATYSENATQLQRPN